MEGVQRKQLDRVVLPPLSISLSSFNVRGQSEGVKGSPDPDSTMESKPSIYCVLLMCQYIYGRERERNQDSKFYLDSKSSRKSKMKVRETNRLYKPK